MNGYDKSMTTHIIHALYRVIDLPNFNKDCISPGQLASKEWMITALEDIDLDLGIVFLCAGWYATLATMLLESKIKIKKIRSFDIDPTCQTIADTFNLPWLIDSWKFKAITEDIFNINYEGHGWRGWNNLELRQSKVIVDIPNTVINSSCEHITNFNQWYTKIPDGTLVILQSNNYTELQVHTNCVNSADELSLVSPMQQTLYLGELPLAKYTRYMKIGIK